MSDDEIVPGVGWAGIAVGRSRLGDVLERWGHDCSLQRYDSGEVWCVNYLYDEEGSYAPDRPENARRPSSVELDDGLVATLAFDVYQGELRVRGGVGCGTSRDAVLATFGDTYHFEEGDKLDTYRYEDHGIELFIDREDRTVNSFTIFAPDRLPAVDTAGFEGDPCEIVIGRGLAAIVIGESTVEDVLRRFGADAQVERYDDGTIWQIDYDSDEHDKYRPDRRANRTRPSTIDIKKGKVKKLSFGVYQSELRTREGICSGTSRAEVVRLLGEPTRRESPREGSPLEKLKYADRGIEIWIDVKNETVNSFEVFAPKRKRRAAPEPVDEPFDRELPKDPPRRSLGEVIAGALRGIFGGSRPKT
jgi:hypothetical protein